MLVDFRVKNFRSIKKEQTLSMIASLEKEFEATHLISLNHNEFSLLKSTVIYGANASGKSNLLKALKTMQGIVLKSAQGQRGDSFPIEIFLFDRSFNEPTEFEISFINKEIRYQYGFSLTKEQILNEWLFAYPNEKEQKWFVREYDKTTKDYKWEFGDVFTVSEDAKQVLKEATRDNALFLSLAVQLNNTQLQSVFDWFRKKLKIAGVDGWNSEFTEELCEDKNFKERILKFLNQVDFDIRDVEIKKEEVNLTHFPREMPQEVKKAIMEDMKKEGAQVCSVQAFHSEQNSEILIPLDLDNESDGTQRFFALIGPWVDSLEKGNVLVIDELHSKFHPLISRFLIELFHEKNSSRAQLIFTTHDTSILNQDILRQDQIWLCEKRNQETLLYPLSDFDLSDRVDIDLQKWYLSGRFGGLSSISKG